MFADMLSAIRYARRAYPGCSFSVKEQPDGPTILSIRQREKKDEALTIIRAVVYIRKEQKG